MRKRFLFIFALIFSINTLSLSALAAPCPHMEKVSYQKTDMPDCHKKASDPQKSGHCKGICFCLHAQLSHNVLQVAFSSAAEVGEPRLDLLHECLKLLEGRARTMCELRYQQDLKPAAIAEMIGMTANSVAKSLQRIREQLRECIDHKAAAQGAVQ